jgi:hypothetical protein
LWQRARAEDDNVARVGGKKEKRKEETGGKEKRRQGKKEKRRGKDENIRKIVCRFDGLGMDLQSLSTHGKVIFKQHREEN